MENLTHSLLGATLAELALPRDASSAQRRLFFASGIIAANLPDGDLLYARIAPPPIGYLLHHRGHTHTLVGCLLLGVGCWLATRLIPPLRRLVAEAPQRFWVLIGMALLSHILADSWNSYGVHPFWPFDNRWFYGDAIFILEPWFWVILGIAPATNARSNAGRVILTAMVIALPLALAWLHMISSSALVALVIGGVILAAVALRRQPRTRSGIALAEMGVFVVAMFGLSRIARGMSLESLRGVQRGEIVDVVLSPNAAQPFCWSALAVEKIEASGEYVLRRGEIAPIHSMSRGCAPGAAGATWDATFRESLTKLRERSRDDCWVRAWLQFGRAPVLRDDVIADVRYGNPGTGGFTEMRLRPLAEARVCPPHLTNWGMPRADLLSNVSLHSP